MTLDPLKRVCDKAWFPSRKAAKEEAERIKRKTGRVLTSYCCDKCGGWHHTGIGKKRSRAITRDMKNKSSKPKHNEKQNPNHFDHPAYRFPVRGDPPEQ